MAHYPVPPGYLSQPEAANRYNRSPRTISRWIAEGRVPGYRFAGRILLKPEDLETMFARIPTSKERPHTDGMLEAR